MSKRPMKLRVETVLTSSLRTINGMMNDPIGTLRLRMTENSLAWEAATRAGRWKEAAVLGQAAEEMAKLMHGSMEQRADASKALAEFSEFDVALARCSEAEDALDKMSNRPDTFANPTYVAALAERREAATIMNGLSIAMAEKLGL